LQRRGLIHTHVTFLKIPTGAEWNRARSDPFRSYRAPETKLGLLRLHRKKNEEPNRPSSVDLEMQPMADFRNQGFAGR
jgi:hypothetical protein